ncbi:hypothetical protein BGW38_000104 [Lunasporangiospora selenospora]|uniref:GDT1 family protein n=1 Tax=Lunasporangiospora selenospora TaxID=979761 RepID=A0A9P6FW55_9FUNG|nr:hypothetical protein BGW38_000104 [Lunasporangiospora selenospora]
MPGMPRLRRPLALMVASILVCLLITAIHTPAVGASPAPALTAEEDGTKLDTYSHDLKDDFEGASGSFSKEAANGIHSNGKIVDEFGDYVGEEAKPETDSASRTPSIDLSTEEAQSFFLSLAMIMVSEIGDKTFLIAAIMAMKHPRLLVFSAALSALAVMSVLSAAFGHAVPNLIPRTYTNYLAALLFFCFGIRMFYDSYYMTEEDEKHELEEVTQELQDKEDLELLERAEAGSATPGDDSAKSANTDEDAQDSSELVGGASDGHKKKKQDDASSGLVNLCQLLFSPIFVQTFIMTFLAEWGDRSQISTIALAAAHDMVWVSVGSVFGHSLCTGVAVIGGRMLASRISVRTVTLAGAVVFEIFAIVSLYESIYD